MNRVWVNTQVEYFGRFHGIMVPLRGLRTQIDSEDFHIFTDLPSLEVTLWPRSVLGLDNR